MKVPVDANPTIAKGRHLRPPAEMHMNLKHGFNRLFVVLAALWTVYCLFVYPLQQGRVAKKILESEFRSCWDGGGQTYKECTQYAQLKSGSETWTLRAYYSRESWFLALVIVAGPALAYGFCRALFTVGWWVWRGFRY